MADLLDITATLDPLGTPVELTDLVDVNITVGRQAQIDNFASARATVVIRYPSGYATPIAGVAIGTEIELTSVKLGTIGFPTQLFYGVISDVIVQYGIPFADNVGPADYLTIECETLFAKLARTSGNGYVVAADDVAAQAIDVTAESGVDINTFPGSLLTTTMSAATVDGSWANWLNQMAFSLAGRITEQYDHVTLTTAAPVVEITTIKLSDAPGPLDAVYDQITFDSLGQNFYTQVTVTPVAVAPQVVESGSAPFRNFTVDTYSPTIGTAQDLANYYLNNYKDPTLGISSVHLTVGATRVIDFIYYVLNPTGSNAGFLGQATQMTVVFRGTEYACIIEGAAFSGTPGQQGVTLYVSSADLNAYLILNNLTLGKLNQNKLGF